jgi:hypothetical protein
MGPDCQHFVATTVTTRIASSFRFIDAELAGVPTLVTNLYYEKDVAYGNGKRLLTSTDNNVGGELNRCSLAASATV